MHLLEWFWLTIVWGLENDMEIQSLHTFDSLLDLIEESLKNKKKMISALTHHNYNYTTNFLLFMNSIYYFEDILSKKFGHKNRIEEMKWSEKEIEVIKNFNKYNQNNWWDGREIVMINYRNHMLKSIEKILRE